MQRRVVWDDFECCMLTWMFWQTLWNRNSHYIISSFHSGAFAGDLEVDATTIRKWKDRKTGKNVYYQVFGIYKRRAGTSADRTGNSTVKVFASEIDKISSNLSFHAGFAISTPSHWCKLSSLENLLLNPKRESWRHRLWMISDAKILATEQHCCWLTGRGATSRSLENSDFFFGSATTARPL